MRHPLSIKHCALSIVICCISCGQRPVYSHYEPTGADGWMQHDSVSFQAAVADSAVYALTLGLRATNDYPYTHLKLVAHCRTARSAVDRHDTLTLAITDAKGDMRGSGTTIFTYEQPLHPLTLFADDTLTVTVAHAMRNTLLPGTTDIGLTVER